VGEDGELRVQLIPRDSTYAIRFFFSILAMAKNPAPGGITVQGHPGVEQRRGSYRPGSDKFEVGKKIVGRLDIAPRMTKYLLTMEHGAWDPASWCADYKRQQVIVLLRDIS